MKEALVDSDTNVIIQDVAIPEPGPGQILVKVMVSGTNPKDWKVPVMQNTVSNTGDDVAGLVEKVGPGVYGFAKGQRVAGFHTVLSPNGSFAEYALLPACTTFHIPDNISFEEAATIPAAAYTSAVALHHDLELPAAWDPKAATIMPVVVYSVSTAIGAFAVKMLKRANIHPIIAIGSKNSAFVTPLLATDKGDAFIDYTAFDQEQLTAELKSLLQKTGARRVYAYDCVSENGTFEVLTSALAALPREDGVPKHMVAVVLPANDFSTADPGAKIVKTEVWKIHKGSDGILFGIIWTAALEAGLRDGWMTPHPYEAIQGLEGLEGALKGLRTGMVRGKKMVIRIGM